MKDRTCIECDGPVSTQSKSGRCRPCSRLRLNSDPEIHAKRKQGLARAHADPAVKARKSAASKAATTPELRELRRQNAKRNYHRALGSPQGVASRLTPEARAKQAKTLSLTKLSRAGVPPEYREEYLKLLRDYKYKRADAIRMIHDQMARDNKPEPDNRSLFERQMDALLNGARLIEKPRLKPADPLLRYGVSDFGI